MKLAHCGLRGTIIGLATLATGCGQSPVERPSVWLDAGVAFDTAPVDLGPPVDRPPAPPRDVPGASCATAPELHDGDVLRAQAFPRTPTTTPVCAGTLPADVRVRWYRATIPAHNVLQVTALQSSGLGVAVVAVSDCDFAVCLSDEAEYLGDGSILLFPNRSEAARSVVVAVTGSRPVPVAVDLEVRIRPIAPNTTCASAMPLVPGVVLRNQDLGLTTGSLATCAGEPGPHSNPALYYSLTVPPRTTLIVESSVLDGPGQHALVVVNPPCGETTCLTGVVTEVTSPRSVARFNNASDAPRAVTVPVVCNNTGGRLTFDLTTTLQPNDP